MKNFKEAPLTEQSLRRDMSCHSMCPSIQLL